MDSNSMGKLCHIPFSQDVILVAALAATAIPFSQSAEDQAERWLRIMRLHGQVGLALQELGVGEAPLMTRAEPSAEQSGTAAADEVVKVVVGRACEFAAMREATAVSTPDLMFALLMIYGGLMDRALYARGTSRDELLERLAWMGVPAEAHAP
jgi:hypothetical protein